MARKVRKKPAAKPRKKSRAATKKKKTARKTRAKAQPKSVIGRAYRTVIDTFTGTGRLRRKMERPGTDETA